MSINLVQHARRVITRTSIWALSLLLVFTANAATAADAIFHQAIVLHLGQQPAPLTESQAQAGPNNDLHHGERKTITHQHIKARLPWHVQRIQATPLNTSPPTDSHRSGNTTRPAYYRFLFRYKPF